MPAFVETDCKGRIQYSGIRNFFGSYFCGTSLLEYFLTERYCLYAAAGDKIYRGEIHHPPWLLQPARAEIALNTMAASHGLELPPAPPLLHFARFQEVWIWAPARLR